MQRENIKAPAWHVSRWFNTEPLNLEDLKGRVIALHTFQMLCPGCVSHGIPQAQKIRACFREQDVAVIGLHTVFEHHEAMSPTSLEAFLHEYGIQFPVGVDEPGTDGPIPKTMAAYGLRGTPSLVLIDRDGFLREHLFGQTEDIAVGALIARLAGEATSSMQNVRDVQTQPAVAGECDERGCNR